MLEIISRSAMIFLAILLGLRWLGKTHIGQLRPIDLVLLLLISNAVQNAMTGPDTSLTGGLIAAGTLITMNLMTGWMTKRVPAIKRWLEGQETMLIYNGTVIPENLEKEDLKPDELQQALREHGLVSAEEVYLAVLEVDGSISVIKQADVAHHARHNRKRPKKDSNPATSSKDL